MNKNKTSQRHLSKYLDTQVQAISSGSKKVRHLTSGEPVHELRLATRQVRAVFWVLKHSTEHVRFKKLDLRLRELGEALGKVREIDVAIADANHFKIKSSKLIPIRMEAVKKLRKLIKRHQRQSLNKLLSLANKSVRSMSSIQVTEAREKLNKSLNHQLTQDIHGTAKLHKLRIAVKKARYAIDAMSGSFSPTNRSNHPMKELQDVLGHAHDLELLQGFTGKNLKIKTKQSVLNAEAVRLSRPALQFAVSQLALQ